MLTEACTPLVQLLDGCDGEEVVGAVDHQDGCVDAGLAGVVLVQHGGTTRRPSRGGCKNSAGLVSAKWASTSSAHCSSTMPSAACPSRGEHRRHSQLGIGGGVSGDRQEDVSLRRACFERLARGGQVGGDASGDGADELQLGRPSSAIAPPTARRGRLGSDPRSPAGRQLGRRGVGRLPWRRRARCDPRSRRRGRDGARVCRVLRSR